MAEGIYSSGFTHKQAHQTSMLYSHCKMFCTLASLKLFIKVFKLSRKILIAAICLINGGCLIQSGSIDLSNTCQTHQTRLFCDSAELRYKLRVHCSPQVWIKIIGYILLTVHHWGWNDKRVRWLSRSTVHLFYLRKIILINHVQGKKSHTTAGLKVPPNG